MESCYCYPNPRVDVAMDPRGASPAECASLPMVDSVSQPWRVTIEAILGLPSTSLHVTLPPRDSVYVRSTG